MSSFSKIWLTASILIASCVLPSGAALRAGDEKPKETAKSGPLLSKEDELTDDDEADTHPQLTNSPRKVYAIKLTKGKTYQIDLKSKDFDAVLRLEDSAGKEVAFNDDYDPHSLDSRIVYTAAKGGDYKIIATCLDKKIGKFKLTAIEAKAGAGGAAASMFKGDAVKLVLKDGKASHDGELAKDDPVFQAHHYKIFEIALEAGKTYRIEHRDAGDDPKFDPFLFLEDANGRNLAKDDDSAGELNARIVHKAVKSATYRIIATTMPSRQTGKFTLEIGPATAEDVKQLAIMESAGKIFGKAPEEQKKILREVLDHLQDRGPQLSVADAQLAMQVASAMEEGDADAAKGAYKDCIKLFSAAKNPQVAGVTRMFESGLKKLDMIGKEIAIVGKTVDGMDFDIKKLKGKVVLVDFWATWCGPCIAEIPNIERAYAKYHAKGFEVIGVSLDRTDAEITKFVEARKLKWTSINVEDSKTLADDFGVQAIPFPVLVDQAGNVVSLRARGPQLEALLERLLAK